MEIESVDAECLARNGAGIRAAKKLNFSVMPRANCTARYCLQRCDSKTWIIVSHFKEILVRELSE